MATSLGGGKTTGMRLMVKNATAGLLRRGSVVSWSSVAANNPAVIFMDLEQKVDYDPAGAPVNPMVRQLEIPVIQVDLCPIESATPGLAGRLGVVAADIPAFAFGEIIVYGLAQIITGAAIAAGEVITAQLGIVFDAANATDKNPIGILVEASTGVGEYRWAFISCLNFDGAGTAFMGKAY